MRAYPRVSHSSGELRPTSVNLYGDPVTCPVYIYIHVYTYIHTHMYKCTCKDAYIRSNSGFTQDGTPSCVSAALASVCVHVHVYTHTHTHTHTHTQTHPHPHPHIHLYRPPAPRWLRSYIRAGTPTAGSEAARPWTHMGDHYIYNIYIWAHARGGIYIYVSGMPMTSATCTAAAAHASPTLT